MSWAKIAIQKLWNGQTVKIYPHGNSMKGRVESGDCVTVAPCVFEELGIDDIVLVKVKGNTYLHLIKDIKNNQFLIGNNHGRINGWVNINTIYGKVINITSGTKIYGSS